MSKKSSIMCLSLIILFASAINLSAIDSKAGTAGFTFLKIGVGARAVALGNSYVAMADDEASIYYNPAGLSRVTGYALSSSYHNYVAGIQGGYLSAVVPWGENRRLGFAINYLSYGDIYRTNNRGEILDQFSGSDLALTVAYSQPVIKNLDFGLAAKFIYESIDSFKATGLAIDLGMQFHVPDQHTHIGIAATNLGFQLSGLSDQHKDPLPIMVKAGVAHLMHNAPFAVVVDGGKSSDNKFFIGGGLEFVGLDMLRLRAGYNTIGSEYKTGGNNESLAGLSFGLGLNLKKIVFDYAYVPYADLGNSHRISIAKRW